MSPDSTPNHEPTQSATDQTVPEHPPPGALSKHDPQSDSATTRRPPLPLVIIIVLVVTALVALHLTGVLGPGAH
jgi:hypothetical protein